GRGRRPCPRRGRRGGARHLATQRRFVPRSGHCPGALRPRAPGLASAPGSRARDPGARSPGRGLHHDAAAETPPRPTRGAAPAGRAAEGTAGPAPALDGARRVVVRRAVAQAFERRRPALGIVPPWVTVVKPTEIGLAA